MKAETSVRDQLARIRARHSADVADHSILQQAAVVTDFDPFDLSELHEDEDHALGVLLNESETLNSGGWILPLERRQAIMARFADRAAVLACLQSIPERPSNAIQQAFEALMQGNETVQNIVDGKNDEALARLIEVYGWIARAPNLMNGLPGLEILERRLEELRRVAPLRLLVGDHFKGREDVLAQMSDYVNGKLAADVLFIHGPGGIGKSTVLAKFALDAAEHDNVDAVVYLNLDRPMLRPEEPLSLVVDLLAQLERQFPSYAKQLESPRTFVTSVMRRFDRYANSGTTLEAASEAGGVWDEAVAAAGAAISELPGDQGILVLIDTFEQAQRHGDSVVSELWRIGNRLIDAAPRMRIIAAGRLPDTEYTDNRLALDAFERSDVARILGSVVSEPVPSDLVDEIFELTGGHPLTVKLAASLVSRLGLKKLADPVVREIELADLRKQRRDALLYGRILQQIADHQVQKIAIPGLVMRRITAKAIREVLAAPCGLKLEPGEEYALFERMAAEVDLVDRDTSDPEAPALVHRSDVRALMLEDLRGEVSKQAAQIDDLAILHFATQAGPRARAEEIYHRIWRGDTADVLDARWLPQIAPLLLTALDELPPERQLWLSTKLGVELGRKALSTLEQADWETETLSVGRRILGRGNAEHVLELLSARDRRLPGSPLYALHAEALFQVDDPAAALSVLDRGVVSATGLEDQKPLAELLLLRSQALEGQRHFADAARDAVQAFDICGPLVDDEFRLRAAATLLRLYRKSRMVVGPTQASLRSFVDAMISNPDDDYAPLPKMFYDNPALTRELAAEIGGDYPDLLELAARQAGQIGPESEDGQGTGIAAAVLDRLQSIEKGSFGSFLSELLGKELDRKALQRNLPKIVAVARDRKVLSEVAKPLSWLLANEVDRLIGAFPSKSMIKRVTGLLVKED